MVTPKRNSTVQERVVKVANPNPSPETRFQAGVSGNAGGLSSETRVKLNAARDKSIEAYDLLVTALVTKLGSDSADDILDAIKGDNLKLLKDIIDRSVGTPKASVDLSSDDGSMTPPTAITLQGVASKDDNSNT